MRGLLLQNYLRKTHLSGTKRKRDHQINSFVRHATGKRVDRKDSDSVVVSMDSISQLPNHIIHQILSNLPTQDVVRTSVLSKTWKNVCDSYPIMDLDQSHFRLPEPAESGGDKHSFKERMIETRVKTKSFQRFVDNSLRTRTENKFNVVKFRLYMTSSGAEWVPHIDRWIAAALESNVKELDLHVEIKKYKRYTLPQTVLTAEKLTALSLFGCKLEICTALQLPLLKNLCLKRLNVDEKKIQNFFASCPLIEDLRLISCSGLKDLKVSSSTLANLKRVEVHFCHGLKSIDIQVPSLQIFWYFGKKSLLCKIDLSSCESMKRLTLEDANMTDEMFQDRISKFPVLEQLILSKCNSLRRIKMTNHRLKSLAVRKCKNLIEADIDTPNLRSLEYDGEDTMPFSSLDPSGLLETKFSFCPRNTNDLKNFATTLKEFLAKSDNSRGSKLVMRNRKNITIHEEWKDMAIPAVNALHIDLIKPSTSYAQLFESLLRTHHPQSIGLASSSSDEGFKVITEMLMEREKAPNCCHYYSKKCWRHYLEDATFGLEQLEVAEDDEITRKWQVWLICVAKSYVGLKWKAYNDGNGKDEEGA